MSETVNQVIKPELTLKIATTYNHGPIDIVECAIQGTIYDLTIIPVKNFGNVGIGYNTGNAYLVINGLTRMSYVFGKGSYIAKGYLAEKLFPRRYWSDADIHNVWMMYQKYVSIKAAEV